VIGPIIADELTHVAMIGLAAKTFARWPVLRLAMSVIRAIVFANVPPFHKAVLGVGVMPLYQHVRQFEELRLEHVRQTRTAGRQAGIAVSLGVGEQRLYCTMLFADKDQAFEAKRILDVQTGTSLPYDAQILGVRALPAQQIGSRDFEVLERFATKHSLGLVASATSNFLERSQLFEFFAEAGSGNFRSAIGLDQGRGYLLDFSLPDSSLILETSARVPRAEDITAELAAGLKFSDPLLDLRLVEGGALSAGDRITNQTLLSHPNGREPLDDPLIAVAQRIQKDLKSFNNRQLATWGTLDVDYLAEMITAHQMVLKEMWLELSRRGFLPRSEVESKFAIRRLISVSPTNSLGTDFLGATEIQVTAGQPSCRIEIMDKFELSTFPTEPHDVEAIWKEPVDDVRGVTRGFAEYIIGAGLGFADREWRLWRTEFGTPPRDYVFI
jgi:hypothetical protein